MKLKAIKKVAGSAARVIIFIQVIGDTSLE